MFRRTLLMTLALSCLWMFSGCTLDASLEAGAQGDRPISISLNNDSEHANLTVTEGLASPTPTEEPTEAATAEATEEVASNEPTLTQRTPSPTPTPTQGSRPSRTGVQPTPTTIDAVSTPTQCLERPTAVANSDMYVLVKPDDSGQNYVVVGTLYTGEQITLTGWWNDGTRAWWRLTFSGGAGWIPGMHPDNTEDQRLTMTSPTLCTTYWPYIEPDNLTPTPNPTPRTMPRGTTVQLAPLEWIAFDGGQIWLRITYINDLRCVPNTECQGDGTVTINVEVNSAGSTTLQMTLKDSVGSSAVVNGYTITLINVDTYRDPPNGPPTGYSITLRVD